MSYNVFVCVPIPQAGIDLLEPHCARLDVGPGDRPATKAEVMADVCGRDGVLCTLIQPVDAEILEAAGPQCRVFANYGAGTDHIDLAAARRLGIAVTNTPGVLTDATADLTWALLLAAARRVVEGHRLALTGRWTGWNPMQMHGLPVAGQTLGIIGAGRIGTAVGLRATGFRMNVIYVGNRDNPELEAIGGRRVDLGTCLTQADFVSLHTPLTDSTRHLISKARLELMKPTTVLINTARGPVVDEGALIAALKNGTIAAAGLDVYEHEPDISPELTALDNVVCLPHLGSATGPTRSRMAEMAASDLLAVLTGRRPEHPVA
jgi:glyoxylate reductase